LAAAEADDQQHALDAAAFKDGLARSLAEGSFRLVIVLDSVPEELTQVVGYLQSVTDKVDIDLVAVAAYEVGGTQVLIPQRVEPARRSRELSDAQVDARKSATPYPGSTEFRIVTAEAPAGQRNLLIRLADWGDELERDGLAQPVTFHGKKGLTTLLPWLPGENTELVSIAADAKSVYAVLAQRVRAPHPAVHPGRRIRTRSRAEAGKCDPLLSRRAIRRSWRANREAPAGLPSNARPGCRSFATVAGTTSANWMLAAGGLVVQLPAAYQSCWPLLAIP
jgi:hypothetical protein